MATASDVRDILSLPQQSPAANKLPAPKKGAQQVRKEAGITRELYQLIGDSAPTLVAQYARPKFKQKPNLGRSKVAWEWQEFKNPVRTDDLQLRHWVKTIPAKPEEEYPFAKYSKNDSSLVFDYSMDEYGRMLEDPDWTKEETDYLFKIAKEYDVRFFVIADRYDFPGGKPRTIQDLKARYYSICRRLLKSRPFAGDESAKNALISSYSFDKERENQRKAYVNGLFARTPAQIAEEEALFIECKRIEQNERRFQRERDDLLRTLGGIESGLASLALRVDDPSHSLPPVHVSGRRSLKRADGMELESPVAGSSSNMIALPSPYSGPSSLPGGGRHKSGSISASGSVTPKHPPSISLASLPPYSSQAQETTFDPQHCLTQPTPSSSYAPSSSISTKSHKPVHLRSSLIPIPKAAVATKISTVITEMGIHPSKLVMPTAANIEKMESLQVAAAGLLEMKKTLDRVDQEVRVLRARLRGGSETGETDGDMGEAERGPDREVSVASGPVERERRNKRSASITSSATSAAADPRSIKRQRRG